MDCNTGAQLGQQLSKDAMLMHGGIPMGAGLMDTPDMLMQAPPQMMGPGMQAPDWAQTFHKQQMDAMRQQHEMEQVFRAQQQPMASQGTAAAMASPLTQQQQMQQMHMMSSQMMGGMMAANMGFGMMLPRTQYQPTFNLGQQQPQQQQQQQQSVNLASNQDTEWIDRLGQQEWGQDYTDVQSFTVAGQAERTVAEQTNDSAFYQFMDKVKNKEVIIDEEKGEVVAGPGPEADVAEDTEYLRKWAGAEGLNIPPAAFQEPPHEEWPDGEPYVKEADVGEGHMDDWVEEYKSMQERLEKVMNNTDYPFEPNNAYLDHTNPYEEGLELLQLSNLAEAALAFEAACQRNNEHFEAWRVLGTTQAENEKDALAIIALNNARKLNPKDIGVHAALAVSHTNEHNTECALDCLKAYLVNHPQYEQLGNLTVEPDPELDLEMHEGFFFADPTKLREVTTLYQAAMELNPQDVSLFTNLGVAYSITHDYDNAVNNFRSAVALRPDDAQLWNKLGATLANASRGEEALAAYERALDINPGYVRAMYNMGVAYNNLGRYRLAAKQIIRAIAMQQGDTNPSGEGNFLATRGMWELLRMTLNLIDRQDLVKLTYDQNLGPLIQEFGLEGMV